MLLPSATNALYPFTELCPDCWDCRLFHSAHISRKQTHNTAATAQATFSLTFPRCPTSPANRNTAGHNRGTIQHCTWGGLGLSPGRTAGDTDGDTDDLDSCCCWFLQGETDRAHLLVTASIPSSCTFCPALTWKCSSHCRTLIKLF